jgi:hypothetical protein
VVQKAPPVSLTKTAAIPNKTTAVADDVMLAKSSAVVHHTTNIVMASVSTPSINKINRRKKAH